MFLKRGHATGRVARVRKNTRRRVKELRQSLAFLEKLKWLIARINKSRLVEFVEKDDETLIINHTDVVADGDVSRPSALIGCVQASASASARMCMSAIRRPVTTHPDFTWTVLNFDGLSRENYEVSRDAEIAELFQIPNLVPMLSRFEYNVSYNILTKFIPVYLRPNTYRTYTEFVVLRCVLSKYTKSIFSRSPLVDPHQFRRISMNFLWSGMTWSNRLLFGSYLNQDTDPGFQHPYMRSNGQISRSARVCVLWVPVVSFVCCTIPLNIVVYDHVTERRPYGELINVSKK